MSENATELWALPGRLGPGSGQSVVPTELAHMAPREQVLLYATVFALAPDRCLEIGVMHGGGSRIIHAALSDLGRGRLIALDPGPQLRIDWATIADRAQLLIGRSPEDLGRAAELAGGTFDFVMLDGDHSIAGVRRDLDGLMKVTRPGSVILAHDAYYWEVDKAFKDAIAEGMPLIDSGFCSTTRNVVEGCTDGHAPPDGGQVAWGGLRMFVRK